MSGVKGKRYDMHANFSRPYYVIVNSSKKHLSVFKTIYEKKTEKVKYIQFGKTHTKEVVFDDETKPIEEKLVYETDYNKIFLGDMLIDDWDMVGEKGTSILINTKGSEYVYINNGVFSFNTIDNEKVVRFHSPLSDEDSPCPVAEGEKYAYFLNDNKYVPLNLFDMNVDLYTQFWGVNEVEKEDLEVERAKYERIKKASKNFKIKTIVRKRK